MDAGWFELHDAVLQLAPFAAPTMPIAFTAMESPFGPSLAGKYGASLISLSATTATGYGALGRHWSVVEEQAEVHEQSVSREDWRIVTIMHVAETKEDARREVEKGLPRYAHYTGAVTERTFEYNEDAGDSDEMPPIDVLIDAFGSTKIACIGTPEDAIETIAAIQEVTGGFGKMLLLAGNEIAGQEATNRSLELFAREVMPAFQGSWTAPVNSEERVQETRDARIAEQRASIDAARANYDANAPQKTH